jgi:hypothetical protein
VTLGWEYCECGCHTCDLLVAGMRFSHLMRWPLATDKGIDLHEDSHLSGKKLGTFATVESMNAFMADLLTERSEELRLLVRKGKRR